MRTFLTMLAFGTFLVCSTAAEKPATSKDQPETNKVEQKTLVEGNNQFAFDMFHRLSEKKGNTIFSPYSISTALAMTYAGAKGNTAKEMAQTLHLTPDNDGVHTAYGELIKDVQGAGKKRNFELNVANSLWGDTHGTRLIPRFQNLTQTDYQAGLELLDFAKDADGARKTINTWVEDKTNKKITNLFPEGSIQADTKLVLTNAIYFKGDWVHPFSKDGTRDADFSIPGGSTVKVPMMSKTFETQYMEDTDFQLAQLKYLGDEMSMVVILPKKKDGLTDLVKTLTPKALEQALAKSKRENLNVNLPRFKATGESSLGKDLQMMGMKDAFSAEQADFSGMLSGPRCHIDLVMHKAFVSVDEKGTEAAAATGVTVRPLTARLDPKAPIPFHVDHPFLFILRHDKTGSILFMGTVVDPTGK